jgi:hypothetical protein
MSAMPYKPCNSVLSPQDRRRLTSSKAPDLSKTFHGGPTNSKENHLNDHFRKPQRNELELQILCSFLVDAQCIRHKTCKQSPAPGATWLLLLGANKPGIEANLENGESTMKSL